MCLGDLGVVVGFAPDRAGRDAVVVDTVRGHVEASILMAPDTRPGDHVVIHSGHVLQVIDAARADEAALLRRADNHVVPSSPPPISRGSTSPGATSPGATSPRAISPGATSHAGPDAIDTVAPRSPS